MKTRPQAQCHPLEPHYANGLCKVCFHKARYSASRPETAKPREFKAACHTDREYYAAGLCYECWNVQRPATKKRSMKRMADCHPERSHYAKGQCQECYDQQKHKRTYPANKDRKIASQKIWYADNKDRVFYAHLKRQFGSSKEKYDALLVKQNHCCAICGGQPNGGRDYFCVDHDHNCCPGRRSCGRCVRGLLCLSCNTGIGNLHDDVALLQRAIAYLTP